MLLDHAMHQKSGKPERAERGQGEALPGIGRDEAGLAQHEPEGLGRTDLLTQVVARANMVRAWKRVKANRGSAGVDGLTIEATIEYLKTEWPRIREELQTGTYRPQPLRRVQIPKSGGDKRELGIPTVIDRLIQQALLLDEVDRELERRGHRFVRYADDNNVYVRSRKAGERLLQGMRKLYARLHLKANESKTAVTGAYGRKFLGFHFWARPGSEIKRAVAYKAIATFKKRIRQITRRTKGRSLTEVVEELRRYMLGWKAHFELAQTPGIFQQLDEWLRHRLRALQLKHWRRGTTMYRELRKIGASEAQAARVAGNACRWWHNSRLELNRLMPIAYFDHIGVPRLS